MIIITKIDTPLGGMTAGATKDGICLLEFSDREKVEVGHENITTLFDRIVGYGATRHLMSLRKQLKEYFKGKRKDFSIPLVIRGTEFQMAVWQEIRRIPFGSTRSYIEQARALKNPESVRAVARANGANKIAIIIPCHRVIGADGAMVGYGGGLDRKKWLLEHEKKYSGKPVEGILF